MYRVFASTDEDKYVNIEWWNPITQNTKKKWKKGREREEKNQEKKKHTESKKNNICFE